MITSIV